MRALVLTLLFAPLASHAQQAPTHEEFLPAAEKAPVVVVISGRSGPSDYRNYAARVAELGYYTMLIDGKDILTREQDGAANLRAVIAKAQASPRVLPGKAVLIGFSQGGGGVLAHGTAMPDAVKASVVYYPATSWARNLASLVRRIQTPILVLAGERDRFNNCCLIEHMREMEALAKAQQAPLELVVYPEAGHAFNLPGRTFRDGDAADAWRRATEMLAKHHSPN